MLNRTEPFQKRQRLLNSSCPRVVGPPGEPRRRVAFVTLRVDAETPNPPFERTRWYGASTWRASAQRAAQLHRWADNLHYVTQSTPSHCLNFGEDR